MVGDGGFVAAINGGIPIFLCIVTALVEIRSWSQFDLRETPPGK